MSSKCMQTDANIMLQIKAIYTDMQCYIKAHHVKGHQEIKPTRVDNKPTNEPKVVMGSSIKTFELMPLPQKQRQK
eukprot:3673493-Ditylum_brightwellii.AAC.1